MVWYSVVRRWRREERGEGEGKRNEESFVNEVDTAAFPDGPIWEKA